MKAVVSSQLPHGDLTLPHDSGLYCSMEEDMTPVFTLSMGCRYSSVFHESTPFPHTVLTQSPQPLRQAGIVILYRAQDHLGCCGAEANPHSQ